VDQAIEGLRDPLDSEPMEPEDFDDYDREAELALYREYRDIVAQFRYVVETERRFYLANEVSRKVRELGTDFYFELVLKDVWVWDIYRSDRFVSSVTVLTFKDVNVEELGSKDLKLPRELAIDE
jgi:hypothetical protein